jgi:hypothetical protein
MYLWEIAMPKRKQMLLFLLCVGSLGN